jgi:predicted permease
MTDLRFALRQLLKNPGFTAVAVLSLALGISANVVVLGWVQSVLLHALPGTREPERLVAVVMRAEWGVGETMSYPNLRDLGAEKGVFAGAVGSDMGAMHVRFGERSEWAWAEIVTANFFDQLGVRPVHGRLDFPADSDSKPGSAPQIVLSERFWRRLFNGDPGVVGRTVQINRHAFTVIGVADGAFKGLTGGLAFDFWAPMSMYQELGVGIPADKRGWNSFHTVARLQHGVTLEQADAAADALGVRLRTEYPNDLGKRTTFGVLPFWKCPWGAQGVFLPLLRALGIAAVLVLLLVVANLANLLLARATVRQREVAVRLAIGASRARLIRQLLTENLLLAGLGGVLAVVMGTWGMSLLHAFTPATHLPLSLSAGFNWQLASAAFGLAVLAGLVFGLVPAWQSSRAPLTSALNEGSRGSEAMGSRLWIRRGLVVAQVALALVLLVSSALCVRSFAAARRIPLGFDPGNVWLASFHLGAHGYDGRRAAKFARELRAELLGRPGVVAVAFSEGLPLGFEGGAGGSLEVPGNPALPGENRQAHLRRVTPGYFSAMRTPILVGREFRDDDDESAPSRIVINQTVAERLYPGRDPVGLKVAIWGRSCEIIGVAAAGKYRTLGEPAGYAVWTPAAQWGEDDLTAVIRTEGDPHGAARLVTEALKRIAPEVDVLATDTLENYISPAFLLPRTAAALLTALGIVALVLALMGIYGVMSFQVNRRRREIGIRLALGARPRDMVALILSHGARLAGAGLLTGLAGAFAVTRLLGTILVDVEALDPLAFAATTALLATAAMLACWVPARRAASVDPMVALRSE